jgi:hypothetical protein
MTVYKAFKDFIIKSYVAAPCEGSRGSDGLSDVDLCVTE